MHARMHGISIIFNDIFVYLLSVVREYANAMWGGQGTICDSLFPSPTWVPSSPNKLRSSGLTANVHTHPSDIVI